MHTKKLSNGFAIDALGFGTWKMGGGHKRDDSIDMEPAKQAVRYALRKGMSLIDTAEMYGMGQTEEMLGEVLPEFNRSKLFITSKVIGKLASYDAIHAAIDHSLARMKLNYLDLYLIHWRDDMYTIEEQMRAMNELYEAGKIRNIGVSNFNKESLQKAQEYSKYPIVLNQVHYNLIYRGASNSGLLEYCQMNDVILQAWRPVQYGDLATENCPLMQEMCAKYDATPSQISINWLLAQKNVTTLFMSRNPEHIDENLASLHWSMEEEDVEKIRNSFPGQKDETHVALR